MTSITLPLDRDDLNEIKDDAEDDSILSTKTLQSHSYDHMEDSDIYDPRDDNSDPHPLPSTYCAKCIKNTDTYCGEIFCCMIRLICCPCRKVKQDWDKKVIEKNKEKEGQRMEELSKKLLIHDETLSLVLHENSGNLQDPRVSKLIDEMDRLNFERERLEQKIETAEIFEQNNRIIKDEAETDYIIANHYPSQMVRQDPQMKAQAGRVVGIINNKMATISDGMNANPRELAPLKFNSSRKNKTSKSLSEWKKNKLQELEKSVSHLKRHANSSYDTTENIKQPSENKISNSVIS